MLGCRVLGFRVLGFRAYGRDPARDHDFENPPALWSRYMPTLAKLNTNSGALAKKNHSTLNPKPQTLNPKP